MSYAIHHINPVLFEIGGPLAVRWYGISYLLGCAASILMLRHWSKCGEFQVPQREVSSFILQLAFFGVFLGGRLGYMFLYHFDTILNNPLSALRVWEGGMASHGGFIGVILFIGWYARKHRYSFWNLTDNMAVTTSLGFAFGRLANFVNGELWGRETDVKWAMIFPKELGLQYGRYDLSEIAALVEANRLVPRHPSQLYQAFTEGFFVFGLMLFLRKMQWGRRSGALSASYLVLYSFARIAMECFREPDNTVYFDWLTKGQLYSILMLVGAAAILWKKRLFEKSIQQVT